MAENITEKVFAFFGTYPLRTFDKRQILIRAESPLPGVFYVVEGRVSQFDVAPSGNEVVVNVFKPGAFFPMSTALNDTPNYYFFEASTSVTAHVAPSDAAVRFLHNNPDVALDLLKRVYRGVDGVLRRMAHLMGGDAQHRLLFEVLNAAYRFGEPQPDGTLLVRLSESDLGKQSGLARETVNRHLGALKAAGALNIAHGEFIIKDIKELEALLDTAL